MRVDDRAELEPALAVFGGSGVDLDRGRGVRRGPRGLLRHAVDRRRARPRLRLALLPERARGDADPVDLARSSSPPTGSTPWPTTRSSARWAGGSTRRSASAPAPRTWSGSSGRRGCGSRRSAVVLPASGPGTSTRRATTSTSTASGPTRSCTVRSATQPSRRFAAGIVALRPDRDGTITGYSGVDEIQGRYGEWVIDAHLPDPGTPTQPVEAGYMANAYVRMRHPDYDVLRGCSTTWADSAGPRAVTPPGDTAITLLGPQRRPTVDHVVADARRGRARRDVTAGWQEREPDDAELDALLGGRSGQPRSARPVARRAARGTGSTPTPSASTTLLDELQRSTSSGSTMRCAAARRGAAQRPPPRPRSGAVRRDRRGAAARRRSTCRVREAQAAFYAALAGRRSGTRWPTTVRRCVASWGSAPAPGRRRWPRRRAARVLHLFHVAPHLPPRVVAWSAGAMALTERVVLFHDHAAQGSRDRGLRRRARCGRPASCSCRTRAAGSAPTTRCGCPCWRAGSRRPGASCSTTAPASTSVPRLSCPRTRGWSPPTAHHRGRRR